MNLKQHETALDTINNLKKNGYDATFDYENDKMKCLENKKTYSTNEMKIDKQFRFEGMTNPSDSSIVFAITCKDGVKGTVMSAYGPYADPKLLQYMDALEMDEDT